MHSSYNKEGKNAVVVTNSIQGKYADTQRWSKLEIAIPDPDSVGNLDMDVSGTYQLLDRCGTALGALHKRVTNNAKDTPLYFFFDPTRNGGA